ncbi:unnamed protein product [Prorocentrum cordatum]|uniref:Sugar phosphate transporter domain-containing protein n=1 Tax=Prorocentrum cordatum TaxID=2364126 RepID=A0ABN9QEN6_9DINO|nr:unnamed protein product [Polarella glacialis]
MLLVGWASHGRSPSERFLPSSLLLVQLGVSAVLALGLSSAELGLAGALLGLHPWSVARCMPVAALFFVSKTCTVAALAHVDAGTVKLSTQLILPCTAFLSVWMIPGCRYSREQWLSIATICAATLAFDTVQAEAEGAAAASPERCSTGSGRSASPACACARRWYWRTPWARWPASGS